MKFFLGVIFFFSFTLNAGEWVAHQASLNAQKTALEQSRKTVLELTLSLSKAKDEASRHEIEKQMEKLKKQLREDEARLTEELAHTALQHPEQGESIKTSFDPSRTYKYAPKENKATAGQGISVLLKRVHEKMVSVYGDHSIHREKLAPVFGFQKEAYEKKRFENERPVLTLEVKDDGNRKPAEPVHAPAPEAAKKPGGH